MKTIGSYSIFLVVFASIFSACRKNDVQPPPDLRFPLPLLTKDTTGDDFISGTDPASFLGKFVIDMYYGTAVTPRKVDIVVIRNDNRSNVQTIKSNVTSFPASIEVTGAQLTTLFDTTIKLGDTFEIGADVTTINGEKFEAFPPTGNPYGADTSALPGYRFSIVYVTHCVFDIASFNGWYTVVTATHEYKVGDSIRVWPGNGNTIIIDAWPNPDPVLDMHYQHWPWHIFVDPETFAVTFPLQQLIGVYDGGGDVFVWNEGSGTVSPCGDRISLMVSLWTGWSWGIVPLELRK